MSRNQQATARTARILAFAAILALLAALPAAAAMQETRTFTSNRLEVRNLIGEVRVESHRGSAFEVVVNIQGADAAEGAVTLTGDEETLNVRFPDAGDFVYPALGRSNTNLNDSVGDWLSSVGANGRISVKGSGKGLELWADVLIRVPQGHELKVRHGVGALIAEGVDADLELSTQSGNVTLESTRGSAQVATGSGSVKADRVSGDRTQIATGSGSVEARDCSADRIDIATGSGDVNVVTMDGRRLHVATGSGDVHVRELAADEANFATGSGKITAVLSRMGSGEFNFGTGSGEISLSLPQGASADIHAETDDGDIEVALADARFALREDDEVRLTVGGGEAKVSLGTGSGDIRISN